MKIVSWNVNSIRARLDHVRRYLETEKPDILLIQELKGEDFPAEDFHAMGYQSSAVTQKAYNGVAILSRQDFEVVLNYLPGDAHDEQARYLEVQCKNFRLLNIYLPNGNPIGTEKFSYKLAWMVRLYERLKDLRAQNIPLIIGGDFNIIPEDKDCHDPKSWKDDALFQPESQTAFRKILYLGLYDAFRIHNAQSGQYTFWDYQAGAWPQNKGIRIDHFLLSPEMVDKMQECIIQPASRGWEKPSDHVPIKLKIEIT